jgi:hypothetical protein
MTTTLITWATFVHTWAIAAIVWATAHPLETIATALGMLGTWLIRKPGRQQAWGFACWCVSNPLVIYVMASAHSWAFALQASVYWAMAWLSVWHHGVKPWLVRRVLDRRAV